MTHLPDSPDPNLDAAKKSCRAHAVAARAQAARLAGEEAGERLAALVDALALPAGVVVAGYWPMGDEIDPRPLMLEMAARGHPLALPVVIGRGQPLEFRAWAPGDELEPGLHGTVHPQALAAVLAPVAVLVPLLAFDRHGGRLGYGGGYYDRTLEILRARSHVFAIGVAFSAQEVTNVPRDGHDQGLDAVATEAGVLEMRRA